MCQLFQHLKKMNRATQFFFFQQEEFMNDYTTVYHISDIHIRLYSRRNEYRGVFERLYDVLRNAPDPEHSLIVVTGDVLHNKIDLQPECTMLTHEFMTRLGEIMPTVVIAGNHDALLNNRDRVDSLTSILYERHPPNVFYYPNTGIYRHRNLLFVVNSLLDDAPWLSGKAARRDHPDDKVIGLYHGQIYGWKNCFGYVSEHGERRVGDFVGCDLVMLGDIHKHQYMNSAKTMAYAGSLISQNFGETDEDHGVLVWDVPSGRSHLIRIENPHAYREFRFLGDDRFDSFGTSYRLDHLPVPPLGNVKIHVDPSERLSLSATLRKRFPTTKFQFQLRETTTGHTSVVSIGSNQELQNQRASNEAFILQYLEERWPKVDADVRARLRKALLSDYYANHQTDRASSNYWELEFIRFENLFGYGGDNMIDFSLMPRHSVAGIFGKNSVGKSTLIEIISFLLYGKITRSSHGNTTPKEVIHFQEKQGWGEIGLRLGANLYVIKKVCTRAGEKIKVAETLYEIDETGRRNQLTDEQRRKTDKVVQGIIGGFKAFLFTNLFLQQREESFRDMKQAARKDFLFELFGLDWFEKYRKQKEEELRTAKAELKLIAARVEQHSEQTWDERFKDLDKSFQQQLEGVRKQKELARELTREREALLSSVYPCEFSSMIELSREERGLEVELDKIRRTLSFCERKRSECITFLGKHDVEDLEEKLKISTSREETPPVEEKGLTDPLVKKYAPGRSNCTREMWTSVFGGVVAAVERVAEAAEAWRTKEEQLRGEINALIQTRPVFDNTKMLEENKDWAPTIIKLRADAEKERVELKELEELLDAPDVSEDTETVFAGLEEAVKAMESARCRYEMLADRLKTDEKVAYNRSCESCMSNPHYLRRKELLQEHKEAKTRLKALSTACTRAWEQLSTDDLFSGISGASWGELVQCARQQMLRRQKKLSEAMKRVRVIRENLRALADLEERQHHTLLSKQARKIDLRISKLERQLATDPLRLQHEEGLRLLQDHSRYQQIQTMWERYEQHENEPGSEVWSALLRQHRAYTKEREDLTRQMDQHQQALVSCRVRLESLRKQARKLKENEILQKKILATAINLKDTDHRLQQMESAVREIESQVASSRTLHQQWRDDVVAHAAAIKTMEFLEMVVKTTERDGLPLYMLKKKLPMIENDVNNLLAPFLDKRLALFVQDKDIVVGIETPSAEEKTTITNYLGGMESFIIDLSLKLGFSKFANLPRSNFFIIDEGISVMDQERISNISHLFDFLANITDHVLLISHLPTIKDFVHQSIDIVKEEGSDRSRILMNS